MNANNQIVKVPFYGNEILVIEKGQKRYVPMKPIVEAIGLDWHKQYELIKRDPVLCEKGIPITGIPSKGGSQEMFCLQLDYLNGWLFKVPATRYKGKKRDAIIRYQKECYHALFNYFHNGGAVNPRADEKRIVELFEEAIKKVNQRDELIRKQQEIINNVTSDSVYGEFSDVTGKRKVIMVRQHYRSYGEPKPKKSRTPMQMVFDFFKGGN